MKYYRVKQNNFLWKAGAIIKDQDKGHYVAVEDIWNVVDGHNEYISATIIENPSNSEYFERVYPDTMIGKLFHTKDQLVDAYKGAFK